VIATAPATTAPSLPVVETFHSLQGEGLHAGRSAFFIRLAGCSVGCPWCDTKHSWPAAAHPARRLAELAEEARQAAEAGAAFAVITGGEPLHHDLGPLCDRIQAATTSPERPTGLPLHLETSGVDPLSGRFAWITLSPKPHLPPRPELLAACHELKVVVHGPDDLAFAEAMATATFAAAATGATGGAPALLLQPGWDTPEGQRLAFEFVRAHPSWRLSLQSHKWLGVR
jgi:organic radical activating enzyme